MRWITTNPIAADAEATHCSLLTTFGAPEVTPELMAKVTRSNPIVTRSDPKSDPGSDQK